MTSQRMITSTIRPLSAPETLADYCARRFTYFTRDQWKLEIADGKLTVDNVPVNAPGLMLQGGEKLVWDSSGIIEPEVDGKITILYEDEWLVAVNKTGNLPVHPSGRYFNHTLTALLADRYGQKVYPVHRIDRETSGVILLAFDSNGVQKLACALASGIKEYLALVHGIFPDKEWIIDLPLGRDPESKVSKKRKAGPDGTEKARTRFQKVLSVSDISLVRCFPETGRLHQIRAHLLAAGYPIVGDKLYGRDKSAFLEFIKHGLSTDLLSRLLLPRQALHAGRITFTHPGTAKELVLRAVLPKMFADFICAKKSEDVGTRGCNHL